MFVPICVRNRKMFVPICVDMLADERYNEIADFKTYE